MHNSADLTKGNLPKQMLLLSLPLLASNLLQSLFNISDIAVVGKFAGETALGSVGSTAVIVTLVTGFLIGIGSGINVNVERFIGAKMEKETEEAVHTSAFICLFSGIALLALGEITVEPLLRALNTKEELIEGAVLYLRIYFLSMPAVAAFDFGSAVFSAAGNTKKPLVYLTAAGIINVVLNLFFMIVLDMSVAGVALASVISQYISSFLVLLALSK